MYTIRLSNGTEYPADYCAARSGFLTMQIHSTDTLLEIAQTLTGNTDTVTFDWHNGEDTFCGYTVLVMVNCIEDGKYIITLKQGE